jgi:hypothetical protein
MRGEMWCRTHHPNREDRRLWRVVQLRPLECWGGPLDGSSHTPPRNAEGALFVVPGDLPVLQMSIREMSFGMLNTIIGWYVVATKNGRPHLRWRSADSDPYWRDMIKQERARWNARRGDDDTPAG